MNETQHHMWCNFSQYEAEGCRQCQRLNLLYPATGDLDYPAMMEKYFPDAQLVGEAIAKKEKP